jgi:nucleoside-triphosphatase
MKRPSGVPALLLTGAPGSGKTTILRKVAAALEGRKIGGFLTVEVRSGSERQGFRLETFDGRSFLLAHVSLRSSERVGRYGVDVAPLDAAAAGALDPGSGADVYLVDEIGRMECLSETFVRAAEALFEAGKPVVATVALRGAGFIDRVNRRRDVEVLHMTRTNRDALPEQILAWLGSRLSGEEG